MALEDAAAVAERVAVGGLRRVATSPHASVLPPLCGQDAERSSPLARRVVRRRSHRRSAQGVTAY
eukprot:7391558-Prymnesium_polylepis.2